MTYQQGATITADDYNTIAGKINEVIGTGSGDKGYGQTEISTLSSGATITAAQWNSLLDGLQKSALHQGLTITNSGESVSAGGNILPFGDFVPSGLTFDESAGSTDVEQIIINRLTAAAGDLTSGSLGDSSRTDSWSATVEHSFTVTFTDANHARHFFNSGGSINFTASRSGGSSTDQNTSWDGLLSAMGTIKFGANATTTSGSGTAASIGFHDLTGSAQQIFTHSPSSPYATNDYTINASISGAVITFDVYFNDDHVAQTGTLTSGDAEQPAPNEGQGWTGADAVDGTLTSTIAFTKMSGGTSGFTAPATPSFSTTNAL
jgi:hypothetical protein